MQGTKRSIAECLLKCSLECLFYNVCCGVPAGWPPVFFLQPEPSFVPTYHLKWNGVRKYSSSHPPPQSEWIFSHTEKRGCIFSHPAGAEGVSSVIQGGTGLIYHLSSPNRAAYPMDEDYLSTSMAESSSSEIPCTIFTALFNIGSL